MTGVGNSEFSGVFVGILYKCPHLNTSIPSLTVRPLLPHILVLVEIRLSLITNV